MRFDPVPTLEKVLAAVMLLGLFLVIFGAATLGGAITRGESNPWVWRELAIGSRTPTTADQVVCVVWYAAFYAAGFVLPFVAITLVLYAKAPYRLSFPRRHRRVRLYLSLAALLVFLAFLEPIAAFLRALERPKESWEEWLVFVGLLSAGFLLYRAYREFAYGERERGEL